MEPLPLMYLGYVMSCLWASFVTLPPWLTEHMEAELGVNATTPVLFASLFGNAE